MQRLCKCEGRDTQHDTAWCTQPERGCHYITTTKNNRRTCMQPLALPAVTHTDTHKTQAAELLLAYTSRAAVVANSLHLKR